MAGCSLGQKLRLVPVIRWDKCVQVFFVSDKFGYNELLEAMKHGVMSQSTAVCAVMGSGGYAAPTRFWDILASL